jgi:hypothetical protein
MAFYLIPLIVFIAIILLLGTILAKRHGKSLATKVTIGVVVFSFLAAFITFQVLIRDTAENINPALDWQKISQLDVPVSELQYRPKSGLFALADNHEIKITDTIPFCSPDGDVANSHPNEIEITTTPYVSLSLPPQPVKQQISFNINYPVETDSWAASSFAVFENGDIWCTERLAQGGQTGGAALGFAAFIFLYLASIIFIGSIVALMIFSIILLEIHRWRKTRKEKAGTN